jgi:hypothetical protein
VPPKERRDYPVYGLDYGILGLHAFASRPDDITGIREYGRNRWSNPDPRVYRYPQKRAAYCAVRRWAFAKNYFSNPPPQDVMNDCRRPTRRAQ